MTLRFGGRYTDDETPPMWFATFINGFTLQRRPNGWNISQDSMARKWVANRDATLGEARNAVSHLQTGVSSCGNQHNHR